MNWCALTPQGLQVSSGERVSVLHFLVRYCEADPCAAFNIVKGRDSEILDNMYTNRMNQIEIEEYKVSDLTGSRSTAHNYRALPRQDSERVNLPPTRCSAAIVVACSSLLARDVAMMPIYLSPRRINVRQGQFGTGPRYA